MKFLLIVLTLIVAQSVTYARKLPSFLTPCKWDKPEILSKCFKETIINLRPYLVNGIPELNLPSVDPLFLTEINLNNGIGGASLNIKAKMTNVNFTNGKEYEIKKFNVNLEEMLWEAEILFPNIIMTADYVANGRLLGIEFGGNGTAHGQFGGVVIKGILKATRKTIKGKEHFVFGSSPMEVNVKSIKLRLDNLIRGQEELTKMVNDVIDENAMALYPDLKPVVGETLTQVFLAYMNGVHKKFTIQQLYPK